ncbi:WbuC family cupin fold metalloprotein [Paludibacter sp.]
MDLIDDNLLNSLTNQAKENQRLRINHNLHLSLDEKVQRLLNAMEPGTILPIHRHRNTAETYIILRGKLDINEYDDNKQLIATYRLDPLEGKYGIHMPAGSWHNVVVVESGTAIFEVKEGPYAPFEEQDIMLI